MQQGLENAIFTPEEVKVETFQMYKAPPLEQIDQLGVQMHWYSFYHKWVPQENYYYAAEHTNFEANADGIPVSVSGASTNVHVAGKASNSTESIGLKRLSLSGVWTETTAVDSSRRSTTNSVRR